MKQYYFKNVFLTGLSVILLFLSCQMKQKDEIKNQSDIVCEPTDTITNQAWEEEYRRLTDFDFAQTTVNVDDTSQISVFEEVCAVRIYPDTFWLTKRQSEMSEDDWMEIAMDMDYYTYEAEETLKKHNIPTLYAPREKRYIKFIKVDKSYFMIDLTKMLDAWGLILFNGNDNPIFWCGTDVDRELKEVYKK